VIKRNVRRKISSLTFCSLTFLMLSHLTVCLLVSRVRAHLSTNQQHGIPCLIKRGPLPDWPVWTRGLMLSGVAAEREDSSVESRKGQSPPSKPLGKQSPPLHPHGKQSPPLQPQGEQSPFASSWQTVSPFAASGRTVTSQVSSSLMAR
jgi:hypothetical protein